MPIWASGAGAPFEKAFARKEEDSIGNGKANL